MKGGWGLHIVWDEDKQQNVIRKSCRVFFYNLLGADFTNESFTVTVPAHTGFDIPTYTLPIFFSVVDDDINEVEQSFALVAEIGPDVTNTCYVDGVGVTECSCFQIQIGAIDCYGRRGATEIRITDNDRNKINYLFYVPEILS